MHGTPIAELKRLRPYVVATGFTTALLGDERTLREFIVGDHMRARVSATGRTTVLILINDSYDPLTDRQLRIGVNKDQGLFNRFESFCGRPISEIPDPFECHASYSEHFAHALLERIHSLGIYPVLVDTYQAYQRGHYAPFVRRTFENYETIQGALASKFTDFTMRNLYRPQCPGCLAIDATNIIAVHGEDIRFHCERCGRSSISNAAEIKGKLSWKLDCAARWNLYSVDLEVFSKAHVSERGTLGISQFISREVFGGAVPAAVSYGGVKMDRGLSTRLLAMLPPSILKKLFLTHIRRDLHLSKDFVENFCQKVDVAAGMSYVDYVRRELPRRALRGPGHGNPDTVASRAPESDLDDPSLIAHGLEFARYYYNREHSVRPPDVTAVQSEDRETVRAVQRLIEYAVTVRADQGSVGADSIDLIRSQMFRESLPPNAYRYLRRILRQAHGPRVASLLAYLPVDHLRLVHSILALYTRDVSTPMRTVDLEANHEPLES